ncbi:hypothetical protein ACWC1D_35520, partial [Streptomyces sp. NPDC001478]
LVRLRSPRALPAAARAARDRAGGTAARHGGGGEARTDPDIFLDCAAGRDFRAKDGAPPIAWRDPESSLRGVEAVQRGPPL